MTIDECLDVALKMPYDTHLALAAVPRPEIWVAGIEGVKTGCTGSGVST